MNTEEMRALVREMPASAGIDFPTERILMHSEAVAPSLVAFSASQHFVDDAEKVESELQKLHVAHMWLHAHLEALEPGSLEYEALAIIHMPLEAYQVMLAEHLRDLIEPPQSLLDVLLGGFSPDVVDAFKQAVSDAVIIEDGEADAYITDAEPKS